MKICALPSVECAVLHDQFNPIDGDELFRFIQERAKTFRFASSCNLMASSTDKDVHVMAGNVRILVSQNDKPLGPEGFANAIRYPATQLRFPDAAEVVDRHQANTFVTIGKGAVDFMGATPNQADPEFKKIIEGISAFTSWEEAEPALLLAETIIEFIIKHNPASAIHWCPCDNLLSPKFFETIVSKRMPYMMYIRPHLHSSFGTIKNDVPVGIIGAGTQWLIGKAVTFEETTAPLGWQLQRIIDFVTLSQQRGDILNHGDTFGANETEIINIRHTGPTEQLPVEQVRLEVVRCDEFGIMSDHPPQLRIEYDENGQVANIADEAVIAPVQNAPSKNATPEFIPLDEKAPVGLPTPSQSKRPKSKKLSIAELRQIARQSAQRETTANTGESHRGGVMQRVKQKLRLH